MKTTLLTSTFFILFVTVSQAQIYSRTAKPSTFPSSYELGSNPKIFLFPESERKEIYRVDSLERKGDMPFRFGKNFATDIDLIREGKFLRTGNEAIRYYELVSTGAYSINLILDRIKFSPSTKLIIYNIDRSFIYGPVTSKNIPDNGVLWTDLIRGDHVVIEITQSIDELSQDNELHLSSVIHGYKNVFSKNDNSQTNSFGDAFPCNNDIACPVGDAWRDAADAVAMSLLDGATRWCSGALLNNVLQDYRPYFLTAFHCLDNDASGVLSTTERNRVNNWAFRFRYESGSCGGPDGTCYVTYNGSNFRAAYVQTDMTLLELSSQPRANHGISFLGWDRSTNQTTGGILIHHPAGDVKKITFDEQHINVHNSSINWTTGPDSPSGSHFRSEVDNGSFQGGSSGAPFLNEDKRVIGQIHGGDVQCPPATCYIGRFSVSWGGGGTNDTRLSNWLDPNNSSSSTVNTIYSGISGPELICTTGTFNLQNSDPTGPVIVWSSSDSNILTIDANSGVATKVNDGSVTINADITLCNGRTLHFQKFINVGLPRFSYFNVNSQPTSNATICTGSTANLQAIPFNPNTTYTWAISYGNANNAYLTQQNNTATFLTYNPACFAVSVQMTNVCGSTFRGLSICAQNCFSRYTVSPNPSKDYVTIQFEEVDNADALPDQIDLLSEKSTVPVKTVDVQETASRSAFKNGNSIEINVADLPRGIYYLHIKNSRREDKQVDIIRLLLE